MAQQQTSGRLADERAWWIEKRWPRRGEPAPWCANNGWPVCYRKAQYVAHVGVSDVGAYCAEHAERWCARMVEQPQVAPMVPEWRRRATAKDLTGRVYER